MTTSATIEKPQGDLRDDLKRLFAKLKLPSSPALAARILALADDPKTTIEQFADAIQVDAALSARLLKLANAAQWGQQTSVTSIQKAVTLLGIGRVRTVALSFQLVGHLNRLNGCTFDMKKYWQHSLLRGCLAQEVAKRVEPAMVDEAFLVGLLQDCGILLLVQLLGQEYCNLYEQGLGGGTLSPTAFFNAEKEKFPHNHVEASVAMAGEWRLPEMIHKPIGLHHQPTALGADSSPLDRLCAISYLVGSVCFTADFTVDPAEPALLQYVQEAIGITPEVLAESFQGAAEEYTHMAELLGDAIPADLDVAELLGEANRRLTAAAGEAEAQVLTVEAERDAIRKKQLQLQTALGEYRDRAARDPLTGILNRGAIVEGASRIVASSATQDPPTVAAIFIDVDNFKTLNDRYGHQTGDKVLKAVAKAINKLVTHSGLVGRYGGEEFVILASGLDANALRQLGQQAVERVRTLPFQSMGLEKAVTCSAGAALIPAAQCKSVDHLVGRADALMYRAKKSGKDRVCFEETTDASPDNSHSTTPRAVQSSLRPGKPDKVLEQFRRLAAKLNSRSVGEFANQRKYQRRDMLAPCVISVLTMEHPPRVLSEKAYVRNISTNGIGLLTLRPLGRGDPIEVCLCKTPAERIFVAGVVTYCGRVEERIHEVGLEFMTSAKHPIISAQPEKAIAAYPWLSHALSRSPAE